MLEGYEQGAAAGDVEGAMMSLLHYVTLVLYVCGKDLANVRNDTKIFLRRAIQHRQDFLAKCILVQYALALQLIGSQEDCCYSTYFKCSEADFLLGAHDKTGFGTRRVLINKQLLLAVYDRDMDAAARWSAQARKDVRGMGPRFIPAVYTQFLHGLVAWHCARNIDFDEQEWTAVGEAAIQTMKKWAGSSDWNFSNKLYLMEAEYYFFKGDEAKASEKYEAAIKSARDHRFIHEEGLANALAASFHIYHKRDEEALLHFSEAKNCYERWGALALVTRMEDEIGRLKSTHKHH